MTATLHEVGIETEKGHSSFEAGMAELRDRFSRQSSIIQRLQLELRELSMDKTGVKEKLSMLIEDSITLKKANADWASRYKVGTGYQYTSRW